jgi:hypothetical protein
MDAWFGRMRMCHLIADTPVELRLMALTIGVSRDWIQCRGTYKEHLDVCRSKRALAVAAGAVEITQREMALKLQERKRLNEHDTKLPRRERGQEDLPGRPAGQRR